MYSPEPVSRSYKAIVGDCSWLEEIATHLNSTVIGEVLYPKRFPLPSRESHNIVRPVRTRIPFLCGGREKLFQGLFPLGIALGREVLTHTEPLTSSRYPLSIVIVANSRAVKGTSVVGFQ